MPITTPRFTIYNTPTAGVELLCLSTPVSGAMQIVGAPQYMRNTDYSPALFAALNTGATPISIWEPLLAPARGSTGGSRCKEPSWEPGYGARDLLGGASASAIPYAEENQTTSAQADMFPYADVRRVRTHSTSPLTISSNSRVLLRKTETHTYIEQRRKTKQHRSISARVGTDS